MDEKEISDFELSQLIESRLRHGEQAPDVSLSEIQSAEPENSIDTNILGQVLRKAALIGNVLIQKLLPKSFGEVETYAVLTQALPCFDLVKDKDITYWCLKLKQREEVINALYSAGTLIHELNQLLPPTDRAGTFLQSLLKQEIIFDLNSYKPDRDTVLQMIKALEWIQAIDIPKPDIEDLRSYWRSLQLLPDQEILLKSGFIGRNAELKQIKMFIAEDFSNKRGIFPSLIINGIGGAGKSTLVAKLCQEIHREKNILLAVLDFDKPGMDPADTYWLESEITRQISAQFPQIHRGLSRVRKDIRQNEEDYFSESGSSSYENKDRTRSLRRLISRLKEELMEKHLDRYPLILILDTFEEITQPSLVPSIQEWLEELQEYLGPIRIKVIYSGRFSAQPCPELNLSPGTKIVDVGEFDKRLTLNFLTSQRLDPIKARQIAESRILPKRPLELKLLAQIMSADSSLTVSGLEYELQSEGGRDLFAGIVYRRVLLRINDPMVRKMAHPGLILRYLTTELIQEVVGPALETGYIPREEARRILDALASYAWLAHRSKSGEVWHRRDLRRSMLKLMVMQHPDVAERIHTLAIDYFRRQSDEAGEHEVLYHKLMSRNNELFLLELKEKECRSAWSVLQPDLEDMPVRSRAVFRYLARRSIRVEDLQYLPERYQVPAARTVAQQFVTRGMYTSALKIMLNRREFLDPNESIHQLGFYYPGRYRFEPCELNLLLNTSRWDYFSPEMESERRPNSIKNLIDLLYIKEVALQGEHDDSATLQETISNYTRRYGYTSLNSAKGELLQKIIACLISLHARDGIRDSFKDDVSELANRLILDTRRKNTNGFQKQLYLIDLITGQHREEGFTLTIDMLPLDMEWLQDYTFKNPEPRELFEERIETVRRLDGQRIKTVLKDVGGNYGRHESAEINFTALINEVRREDLVQILIGSYPEFRNPCKYVIIEIMNENREWKRLFELFMWLIRIDIGEMSDSHRVIEEWIVKPESSLDPYIELIDRCWKLPMLMRELNKHYPENRRLDLVTRAINLQDENAKHIYYSLLENMNDSGNAHTFI